MTYNIGDSSKVLSISRGRPNAGSIQIDLAKISGAESRLGEINFLQSHFVAAELMVLFNDAANDCGKNLAAIEYELLSANNVLEQIKSDIILDDLPKKMDELGLKKSNEDIRNALIVRNQSYQQTLEIINHLKSVQYLLTEKIKCFVRAYNACRMVADRRSSTSGAIPNLSTNIGALDGSDEPMVASSGRSYSRTFGGDDE